MRQSERQFGVQQEKSVGRKKLADDPTAFTINTNTGQRVLSSVANEIANLPAGTKATKAPITAPAYRPLSHTHTATQLVVVATTRRSDGDKNCDARDETITIGAISMAPALAAEHSEFVRPSANRCARQRVRFAKAEIRALPSHLPCSPVPSSVVVVCRRDHRRRLGQGRWNARDVWRDKCSTLTLCHSPLQLRLRTVVVRAWLSNMDTHCVWRAYSLLFAKHQSRSGEPTMARTPPRCPGSRYSGCDNIFVNH
uniref:Uncharacterized protein n=1 Tax=Plectus sambesii TaxID=2011161 RepID=A0A914W9U1_9BILA